MGFNLRQSYSGYLKKEDFPKPALLTIASIEQVQFDNETEVSKILHFEEMQMGMVLNKTNGMILCSIYGDDTDDMIGQKIVVYSDPSIQFQGRMVGGLRLRAPKQDSKAVQAAPKASKKQPPVDEDKALQAQYEASVDQDDDIPF